MVDDWGQCPDCSRPRLRGQAFAWCGGDALWRHDECAAEHRPVGASLTRRPDGHGACCGYYEVDHGLPSQHEGVGGWIQVEGETWPRRTPWTGKWMLFWPPSEVDDRWEWVRWGTLGGEHALGYAAKVADFTNLSPRDGTHTCCVYTVDCRDLDDVRRVLRNLRRLGFDQKLFYKDDAATDALRYGPAGVLYRAAAGSIELTKVREPVDPERPDAATQ